MIDEDEMILGEIAAAHHEHPALPGGRLPNGCWPCIRCGRIVAKGMRWLNRCSGCGYDLWDEH